MSEYGCASERATEGRCGQRSSDNPPGTRRATSPPPRHSRVLPVARVSKGHSSLCCVWNDDWTKSRAPLGYFWASPLNKRAAEQASAPRHYLRRHPRSPGLHTLRPSLRPPGRDETQTVAADVPLLLLSHWRNRGFETRRLKSKTVTALQSLNVRKIRTRLKPFLALCDSALSDGPRF